MCIGKGGGQQQGYDGKCGFHLLAYDEFAVVLANGDMVGAGGQILLLQGVGWGGYGFGADGAA